MLGVGLIGLGMIADTHVLAISSSSNCYLRGAFDSVPGKAEAFAAKNGGSKRLEAVHPAHSEINLPVIQTDHDAGNAPKSCPKEEHQ